MIDPRVSCSCENAARDALNDPIRSISITVLKPFGDNCSAGTRKFPAAPHTSTSTGPSSALVFERAASSAANSRTSATAVHTLAPIARNWPAASSSFTCVRPQMLILAPTAAKFFATPRLIPLPPPVMNTVLPVKSSLEKYELIFMLVLDCGF